MKLMFCEPSCASGDTVALPPPQQLRHMCCSSQNRLSFWRELICHVVRSVVPSQTPSLIACWLKSGSYVNEFGLPAFLLMYMPAM